MHILGYVTLICILGSLIYWVQQSPFSSPELVIIVQTYLYLILGLLIIMLINQQSLHLDLKWILLSFFIIVILLQIQSTLPAHQSSLLLTLSKHIIWLIMVLCLGFIISWVLPNQSKHNLVIVVVLMVILSILAYLDDRNLLTPAAKYFVIGICVIILVEMGDWWYQWYKFGKFSATNVNTSWLRRRKIYSLISIMFFTLLILSETQKLKVYAKHKTDCLGDPLLSTNLLIDGINLFTQIVLNSLNFKIQSYI